MVERLTVMVSSTARDLPDHRGVVMDACLRQDMFPVMMEHLPASDDDAIGASLAMVDKADIYLGIFAHRYGYVPAGHDKSVTEMEYDRAVARGIPRLIFLMHDDHPIKRSDVETGEAEVKLKRLKDRLSKERVVNSFSSPSDLRSDVINSLSKHRPTGSPQSLHFVSDIPAPPEIYVAHPYTLLQTKGLIGRQEELNLLTDWVSAPETEVYQARVLAVVAIGGMGKSALTWKWFNDIAPEEMKPLAGRMWWSFYESDATFDNFVTRALAYVTRSLREDLEGLPLPERMNRLLTVLDREPFLIVLDGLERLLIAYARLDAARMTDDEVDRETANVVASELGLPKSAAQSYVGQHRLRQTVDRRVGDFLRRLVRSRASRILISTRLFPTDLQTPTGDTWAGCHALFLRGLSDADALNLWRSTGVSGSREELVLLFRSFENHPLLIHALASRVAHDRNAPRDFDRWRASQPNFNPLSLPLVQVKSHVLQFALQGLDHTAKEVLWTIAAFRAPASYETLLSLLVGEGRAVATDNLLDEVLADIEDKGLLGWDRRSNRYDLHPIVRGVVWSSLTQDTKVDIFERMQKHFEAIPWTDDNDIRNIDDLSPSIELYDKLIGLGRYSDALKVFDERIIVGMAALSEFDHILSLVRPLFPNGLMSRPLHLDAEDQMWMMWIAAVAFRKIGQPKRAIELSRTIEKEFGHLRNISSDKDIKNIRERISFSSVHCLCHCGSIRDGEFVARRVLDRDDPDKRGAWYALLPLGWVLAVRGATRPSSLVLQKVQERADPEDLPTATFMSHLINLQMSLWQQDFDLSRHYSEIMHEDFDDFSNFDFFAIEATRLFGVIELGFENDDSAERHLQDALARAQSVNDVEETLQCLIGLAELRRRQGFFDAARELLADVWGPVEEGPYRLFHTDALNVLARIERDAGNSSLAIAAATNAHMMAWCDGPPYTYDNGLREANSLLAALGAPEPRMPPFDESNHEPMVEIPWLDGHTDAFAPGLRPDSV